MKRDFDLIRNILLQVEAAPAGTPCIRLSVLEGYDQATVYEHIGMLKEAGLLEAAILRGGRGILDVHVKRLTWEGHDFIQAASQESVWTKAMSTVKEKGGAVTFDVLKELLKRLALGAVGL